MRQPLVAGNWKMNGSRAMAKELIEGLKAGIGEVSKAQMAVCPTFVHLPEVASLLESSTIQFGSQDVCDRVGSGAFTGEVSGEMLKEFGCTYAIVGHSERRSLYGESDEFVAQKFAAARQAGLKPILCVGETLDEREGGITEEVVGRQLDAVIDLEGVEALADGVIAYEPVWAIGTGKTATPEQAQETHAFIRGKIATLNAEVAGKVQILYGGSMKPDNAAELMAKPDIDGGLIGGASLKAADFLAIGKAAG